MTAAQPCETPRVKRRSPAGEPTTDLILSAHVGTNDDLFPQILRLYVRPGSLVADTTFGKGVFWKKVPAGFCELRATDLLSGVDARKLPYDTGSLDCVVFDPPYMHSSGGTAHAHAGLRAFEDYYRNNQQARVSDGHLAVLQLYFEAAEEAQRVLKRKGIYIVKCADEVAVNLQRLTHVEIINHLSAHGWTCEDLFVLVRHGRPGASRIVKQLHSRKSHSYFLIFRKQESGRTWTGP